MKRILLTFALVAFALSAMAAPIGEKRAREIAKSFFATATRSGATPSLNLAWAGNDMEQNLLDNATRSAQTGASDDALLYIYNRTDAAGFVIIAGDDNAKREIVAFSYDNSFDTEDMADGAKAMLQAWCEDISEARNNKSIKSATRATPSTGNIVKKYETAKWGQGAPFNNECPMQASKRTITGCVATALAIVCHYHKWPERGVGTVPSYSYTGSNKEEMVIPENVLGRTYDYDNMLLKYSKESYTDEQAAAVAALMYDIGSAVSMHFNTGGSSAYTSNGDNVLINYFSYSKQSLYIGRRGYSDSEWIKLLQDNIYKYGPTCFSGTSTAGGGHAFVLDGYTDADYFSINYGWNGGSNGFYLMPDIKYIKSQAAIFSATPDKDGTSTYRNAIFTVGYNDCKGMLSQATKYEQGASFKMSIAVLNCGITNFSGSVCIAHCDKNNEIKEILRTYSISLRSFYKTRKSPTITLSKSVEEGDCLLVFFKGEEEEQWTRAYSYSTSSTHFIPLCCSSREIAETLNLEYDKATRLLSFSSPYATQCSITDHSGRVVASSEVVAYGTGSIDLSQLSTGEYNCSFAASGAPYTFKLKLSGKSGNTVTDLEELGSYVDNLL